MKAVTQGEAWGVYSAEQWGPGTSADQAKELNRLATEAFHMLAEAYGSKARWSPAKREVSAPSGEPFGESALAAWRDLARDSVRKRWREPS